MVKQVMGLLARGVLLPAATALVMVTGCADDQEVSSSRAMLHALVSEDISLQAVDRVVAGSHKVVIVNLNTSRSTYIKEGEVVESWNSVTADVTGEWHKRDGVPVSQSTPPGVYSVHEIQHCPIWRPRSPKDPETKKHVDDEQERQRIFRENPDVYGPCGKRNPLGEFVAWFYNAYGYHGSAGEHHWRFVDKLPLRRASGGCLRNPWDKARMIFKEFLSPSALQGFWQQVENNQRSKSPQTLTLTGVDAITDIKIIVGDFPDLSYEVPEPPDADLDRYLHLYEYLLPSKEDADDGTTDNAADTATDNG